MDSTLMGVIVGGVIVFISQLTVVLMQNRRSKKTARISAYTELKAYKDYLAQLYFNYNVCLINERYSADYLVFDFPEEKLTEGLSAATKDWYKKGIKFWEEMSEKQLKYYEKLFKFQVVFNINVDLILSNYAEFVKYKIEPLEKGFTVEKLNQWVKDEMVRLTNNITECFQPLESELAKAVNNI